MCYQYLKYYKKIIVKRVCFNMLKWDFWKLNNQIFLNWKIIVRNGELNKINLKKILFMNWK